jgi:pimeloyl-ACP methyl ester carboxylesterase
MPHPLVEARTADGLRLHGLEYPANGTRQGATWVLLVHGLGGNFYTRPLPRLAQALSESGYPSLTVNTRGHDWISNPDSPDKGFIGASYEHLHEAPLDLDAFISYLKEKGAGRLVLLGHSLGGAKVLHYQSERANPMVSALVLVSPAWISYESRVRRVEGFAEAYQRALKLVGEGRQDELIRLESPRGSGGVTIHTAGTFAEKYGQPSRYDGLKLIGNIRCPIIVTAGSEEPELSEYARSLGATSGSTVDIVQGAGHYYDGRESQLSETITRWLGKNVR